MKLVQERAAAPGKFAGPYVRHLLAKPDPATALDLEALKKWRAQQEAEYERALAAERQKKSRKGEGEKSET